MPYNPAMNKAPWDLGHNGLPACIELAGPLLQTLQVCHAGMQAGAACLQDAAHEGVAPVKTRGKGRRGTLCLCQALQLLCQSS